MNDETHLLSALRAGDAAAFETLVRTHTAHLLSVARRIMRHEEDARDAVQEAFLAALKGLERFSGKSRLGTWLHRIVVNSCLMTLRRRRARPEFLCDTPPDPRPAQLGESRAERRETVQAVRAGIDRLPAMHRRVLKLRELDGVGTREMARRLDVTPNAVKTRLYRARLALRTELAPRFGAA